MASSDVWLGLRVCELSAEFATELTNCESVDSSEAVGLCLAIVLGHVRIEIVPRRRVSLLVVRSAFVPLGPALVPWLRLARVRLPALSLLLKLFRLARGRVVNLVDLLHGLGRLQRSDKDRAHATVRHRRVIETGNVFDRGEVVSDVAHLVVDGCVGDGQDRVEEGHVDTLPLAGLRIDRLPVVRHLVVRVHHGVRRREAVRQRRVLVRARLVTFFFTRLRHAVILEAAGEAERLGRQVRTVDRQILRDRDVDGGAEAAVAHVVSLDAEEPRVDPARLGMHQAGEALAPLSLQVLGNLRSALQRPSRRSSAGILSRSAGQIYVLMLLTAICANAAMAATSDTVNLIFNS